MVNRFLVLVSLVLLAGCSRNLEDLSGTWLSACDGSGTSFARTRYKFEAKTFEIATMSYKEAECANAIKGDVTVSGTYELKKDEDPGDGFRAINFTVNSVTTYEIYKVDPKTETLQMSTDGATSADTRSRTVSRTVYTRAK